tara:strand:+ start:511 stop:1494 length:984 start_codon:yes stop_codon:yes gene_type:complete
MKTKIIAEIGNNHGGNFDLACEMVEAARDAGADYAKFQIYEIDEFLHKNSDYYSEFKREDLSFEGFRKIFNKYDDNQFKVIATPFDIKSAKFLLSLGIETIKIASGDIDNFLMFEEVVKKKPYIIFSTGGASETEIHNSLNYFKNAQCRKITMLHCIANYPANNEELNVQRIENFKMKYACDVGYSDHSTGLTASLAAVCKGANLIEKHFTTDKSLPGGDNEMSINKKEMIEMKKIINDLEIQLGYYRKNFSKDEIITKKLITRKFYSKNLIRQGEKISSDNLIFLRTQEENPLSFGGADFSQLINSVASKEILPYKLILKSDICQI